MTNFAVLSMLVSLAALFGLISHRVLRLPSSIGTAILALGSAGAIIAFGHADPAPHATAARIIGGIDFNQVVLHSMLAFLLFAGALQLDVTELRRQEGVVASLAIVTTGLSTLLVALLFKGALWIFGIPLSTMSALLFGALISPTDPIAVLEMLRRVGAPLALEAQLAGESLFNDGFGAVIFVALSAASASGTLPSPGHFLGLLLLESCGAVALGGTLGYVTYRLLLTVDSYRIEVLLTLALAMGGYALADALHLSAPLEVVTAGLFVGAHARPMAMSAKTQAHVATFWELLDDIFNVLLFLLLGLELLVLPVATHLLIAGVLAIPVVLAARAVSVGATMGVMSLFRNVAPGTKRVLTWGGLRGGLAVALALALPKSNGAERNLLLSTTYIVVFFSIVVQGLTIGPLLRRLGMQAHA